MNSWLKKIWVCALGICSMATLQAAPWTGAGSADAPFLITDASALKVLASEVNSGNYADSCFKLTADIDLGVGSDTAFTAIGNINLPFKGVFDGSNHIVSNLFINEPLSNEQGLFGCTAGATIQNMGLKSVSVSGKDYVGGLIGYACDNSTVTNVSVTGNVTGKDYVGGLIGYAYRNRAAAANASAVGKVVGKDYVGGLIGSVVGGLVTDVYARGTLSGRGSSVGGLVGRTNTSVVLNAYAAVSMPVGTGYALGGLIGRAIDGSVENGYWDAEFSEQNISQGGTGKTTAGLQDPVFVKTLGVSAWRWDKNQDLNGGYPVLVFQGGVYPEPEPPMIQQASIGEFIEVKNSDFGNLNGKAVVIGKKTLFAAAYIPAFKPNAAPRKLAVKLNKNTISGSVQKLQIKNSVSLLNPKCYKHQLKIPMTTREILLSDSVEHTIQLDSVKVNIAVAGKRHSYSDSFLSIVMVPPSVDSVEVVTLGANGLDECLYAVVAVRNLGMKPKGWVEYIQKAKVKKIPVNFIPETKWAVISELSKKVRSLHGAFPEASVSVIKLPKKFKTLPSPDCVIDNRNGLSAVSLSE